MLDPRLRRRREETLLDRYGRQLGYLMERRHVEAARQAAHDMLECRVREKTAELERTNANLQSEVSVRQRTEDALRTSERSLQERVAELERAQSILRRQGEEMARIAAELRMARDDAVSADRSKSEFLAAMSHELRTPLNAIIGFSEMMKIETLGPVGSPQYRGYANDIYQAGSHLLALINDILDLSKVESGADELHEETVSVPDLVASVQGLVRQRASGCGVQLVLDVRDDLPLLMADERKLKQILVNLLSNAVKFTEADGQVTLKAWCRPDSGFVFQVIDTGIGMAAEDIPKALAQFGQIDSDLNRKYDGTGLGLPLAKSLIELHGGYLDLQSEVGAGTTVTVRLPAYRIAREAQATPTLGAAERPIDEPSSAAS
jgi:two-component system cell cycle sensor histidine kinase PleC